jgi:hypothetical protein
VFGVDQVPLTLADDQYSEFFRLCNEYIRKWKSKNTTSIEMLFLQVLSYYVDKFDAERFVISIQTRMPVLKIAKKKRQKMLSCEGNIAVHLFY